MIDWEGRRIEPCACGGYLVSAVKDEAIVRAVWHHPAHGEASRLGR